jgi:hypothetical protein
MRRLIRWSKVRILQGLPKSPIESTSCRHVVPRNPMLDRSLCRIAVNGGPLGPHRSISRLLDERQPAQGRDADVIPA